MDYFRINRNLIFSFLFFIFFVITVYSLFLLQNFSYYIYVISFYFLTLIYFTYIDIKIKKIDFFRIIFFLISVILIGLGQHIFSFFNHQRIIEGSIFFIIGIIFLIISEFINKNSKEVLLYNKPTSSSFEKLSVFFLLVISFLLRFYNLEKFFPGVWYDEAQNGAETLHLMSLNYIEFFISRYTYMPSMFFYISSVFVKLFGYNIFSLRFVSVVLGTLSVIAFYFLLKEIFKNWQIAIFGAFIYTFSRWHLNFSRIAFLGMQTVLLLTVFAYFYIKALKTNRTLFSIFAGISLGIANYTYGVVYFIHFVVLFHCLFLLFKNFKLFFKEKIFIYLKIYLLVIILSMPLIIYAIKTPTLFFQRANDISFFNEIKSSKSLEPLIKNITSYLLCFNFEGDYNGRHNLYKKPLFDYLSGIFFVMGVIYSFFTPGFRFFILWLAIMFIPGVISITIETPQFYRIIGAMPAAFIVIILGIYKSIETINNIIKNKKFVFIMYLITFLSISVMNFYQYYFLYPKAEGTYLSFSPEASRIGQFINEHKDYLVIISPARNMYGFYQWEQRVICDFLTYKKSEYKILTDSMVVYRAELEYLKKKGIVIILRPSDKKWIEMIEHQYKDRLEKKEEYKNPFNNEPIFYCYYIRKDDIIISKDTDLIIRME